MKITIETIPHKSQAYETVGDWYWDEFGNLEIKVSEMGDWRYEFLVALHEMVEVMLCRQHDIGQEAITDFDIKFESLRDSFPKIIGQQEPGDMVSAPYHEEHVIATGIERRIAVELAVNWKKYNDTVEGL